MDNLNLRCAGVRRLMKEAQELSQASELFYAQPLEDNLFEWHFTVRGPPDTPFEGGVYHGRIILPTEYPMKPPNLILLTPNGRFQTNTKICLSISGYHPETWLPSWSIRTALLALIGFFPTQAAGALGGIDCPDEEKCRLALKSQEWRCETCKCIMKEVLKPLGESQDDSTASEDLKLASEYAKPQNSQAPENAQPQNSESSQQSEKSTQEVKQEQAPKTPESSQEASETTRDSEQTPTPLAVHPSVAELRARLNRIANSHSAPVINEPTPMSASATTTASTTTPAQQPQIRVQTTAQAVGDTANAHSNFWSFFWMAIMSAIFFGLLFRRITLSRADVE